MSSIGIIVLAAGSSSRMKITKQLIKINQNLMLDLVLNKAISLNPTHTYCVLGANADTIFKQTIHKNVNFVVNTNHKKGLSSSINLGVKHIINNFSNISGVLILLADQPAISLNYLKDMFTLFKKNDHKIVASKYKNTFGVPAIFPKSYFEALETISGDSGAKELLKKERNNIIFSKIDSNFVDIDTPEDLHAYLKENF